MTANRRKDQRRHSDRALEETVQILQILEKVSQGDEIDFTEHYADLVGMKDRIGRRQDDRKVGESLCLAIEALADNIAHLLSKEKGLRKVRVTKMSGKKEGRVKVQSSLVGWEEMRPHVGRTYRVFKDDGGVFRSAVVTKVLPGYFQTQNSVYRLDVVTEA
jgi:hypothetical protein